MSFIRRLLALCALALLVACKQPSQADPNQQIVQGSPNVQVESLQIVSGAESGTSDSGAGVPLYYVCKVVFTNNFGTDLTPAIDHFVFSTPQGVVSQALTSGSTATVGITNYTGIVKAGEKHEYTLVFRAANGATGTIYYQP